MTDSAARLHSRAAITAVLVVLFAASVWSMVFHPASRAGDADDKFPDSRMGDQIRFHEPVIRAMAEQWPHLDLVNYNAASTPGYHIVMAAVARYLPSQRLVLQLVSSLFGLALMIVVFRQCAVSVEPLTALVLVLPLLASRYLISGSIWLGTDNAALLLVSLAVGGVALRRTTVVRTIAASVAATLAVLFRQVHLWAIAPVGLVVVLASPLGRWAPGSLSDRSQSPWSWKTLMAIAPLLLGPFLVVGAFVLAWGGFVPAGFTERHDTGLNPAAYPYALALVGAFGVFYLPACGLSRRELTGINLPLLLAIGVAVGISLVVPTSASREAGRWGGVLWTVIEAGPVIGGRSVVMTIAAALGAFVLLHLWRAARDVGKTRGLTIVYLSLVGWLLAQSMNAQVWQRYYEPLILIALAWLVSIVAGARSASGRPVAPWTLIPLLVLAMIQLGMCVLRMYLPVINSYTPD